jgi:hypothetical protein
MDDEVKAPLSKRELDKRMEKFLGWSDKDKAYGEAVKAQNTPESEQDLQVDSGVNENLADVSFQFDDFPSYGYEQLDIDPKEFEFLSLPPPPGFADKMMALGVPVFVD